MRISVFIESYCAGLKPVVLVVTFALLVGAMRPGSATAGEAGDASWWRQIPDPALHQVIDRALLNNRDVIAASARVAQAEALAMGAASALYPHLSANLRATLAPYESLTSVAPLPAGETAPDTYIQGTASLDLTYRLSAWGKQWASQRALSLRADAAHGDSQQLRVALLTQVTAAYFDRVAAQMRQEIIHGQVQANEKLLESLQRRYEQGETDALALLQQKQQAATTRAELPAARSTVRAATDRLLVLLGETDPSMLSSVATTWPTLRLNQAAIDVTAVVEQRPDVRAARLRAEASSASVSSAYWTHAPTIDLSGSAGYAFRRINDTDSSDYWQVGVAVSLPLFSGFGDHAQVSEAAAAEEAAIAAYDKARQQAHAEIRSALVSFEESSQQLDAYQAVIHAADASLQESYNRYQQGVATFLDVVSAINGKQRAELAVVNAQRARLSAYAQLQQALATEEPDAPLVNGEMQ